MSYSGEVIDHLSPPMQEMLAETAARQREIAPAVAEALMAGELSPGADREDRHAAAAVLNNFAAGRLTERGFENVPLTSTFGESVLPGSVRAITSYRVPVDGSNNHFGLRPSDPNNKPNYLAFLGINGLGAQDMIAFNTAGTGNHVAVVSHDRRGPEGLVRVENRILPADGQDEIKRTADALILTNPDVQKGLVGTAADIPIVVGTAGDAMFAVNGGWNNLAAGVDLTLREKMKELGLLEGPVNMAVGPGGRVYEVRRTRLSERAEQYRTELGGDPRSHEAFIDLTAHQNPEKTYLDLAQWAQATVGSLAFRGGVVGLELDTIRDGQAGLLHSSRVERKAPTVPGEPAGGDRGMVAIVPVAIQRSFDA